MAHRREPLCKAPWRNASFANSATHGRLIPIMTGSPTKMPSPLATRSMKLTGIGAPQVMPTAAAAAPKHATGEYRLRRIMAERAMMHSTPVPDREATAIAISGRALSLPTAMQARASVTKTAEHSSQKLVLLALASAPCRSSAFSSGIVRPGAATEPCSCLTVSSSPARSAMSWPTRRPRLPVAVTPADDSVALDGRRDSTSATIPNTTVWMPAAICVAGRPRALAWLSPPRRGSTCHAHRCMSKSAR
mmetsp:Transcript_71193/g.183550  ORF Transcript_71193/g.183550 Transcript_71193/m.183550 type:complete len:248 (+) Transcript_71193:702-1445(+)